MKQSFILTLSIILYSFNCTSQTVNIGEMTVGTNTIVSTLPDFNNTNTGTLINDGDFYIYSNFNNDGIIDFIGTTGLTRFIGDTPKVISGGQTSYLYNSLFNNTANQSAFQLSGSLSITNESQFNLGIIDNDNFGGVFRFEQFGNHINVSDISHVSGAVIKVGDTSFEYPIGNGAYYRMAGISAPDADKDTFTSEYFFEKTATKYPTNQLAPELTLINDSEYWKIEKNHGSSDILLTLTWHTNTTSSKFLTAPLKGIHIARWDPETQQWEDKGGVVDIAKQSVTTHIDEYGVFTLARVKEIESPCGLIVYNVLTPNNDGRHDYFKIKPKSDESCIRNLEIKIFNRWGTKIFESDNYGDGGELFRGKAQTDLVLGEKENLPTGTYFYLLTVNYINNQGKEDFYTKTNYLYLTSD